jgi:hypothetical protein
VILLLEAHRSPRHHDAMKRLLLPLLALLVCCSSEDPAGGQAGGSSGAGGKGGGQGTGGAGPVCSDCTPQGALSFRLPSPPGATLWTAPPASKILREVPPPEDQGDAIQLYAARNEFEPFQLVVNAPSGGAATLALAPLQGPGSIARLELHRVEYVKIDKPSDASSLQSGQVPDPLWPSSFGQSEPLPAGQNQPFWVTLYVPPDAPPGDYTGALEVTVNGASRAVPIKLHVYDFTLPARPSFDGNWNGSFQALGGGESLEATQKLKDFFFEHRLTPSSVAWPAGLNYNGGIEYDCAAGDFKPEAGPYSFAELGPRYIDGQGWNGAGFPSFQIMQFVNNSTPRPQQFCGVDRGPDHKGTEAYNAAWSKLLGAIDRYLVDRGWEDRGYYYVQNEPQGPADYDTAAFLANLSKTAAPHLRIAVSEEPKPEIAEHPAAAGKSFDLWWADLSAFEPGYARKRQALGEQVWWYFLYGDRPPHFNPITIDHDGIEGRIAFWAAWKYRIKGFAYYSLTGWGADPYTNPRPEGTDQNGDGFLLYPPRAGKLVPSIRWELLREGAEDFEYFLLASGGQAPATDAEPAPVDTTTSSAVSSTTSFTRDASALQGLRNQLGLKIEGKINGFPVLDAKPPGAHPRAAYYLNFQDPKGPPTADPLVVDGHTWTKIGWDPYDPKTGQGWAGPFIGDPKIMLYQYLEGAPVSELQKSILFNDYGRTDTFTWDLENGRYKVTVSIGWHNKTYAKHRVVVEGKVLFDSVGTTPEQPYRVASVSVDVADGNLTLEAGQTDEYTMLNWLSIEPE